eukprot:320103-Hanusia_phi.AAC.1
MQKLLNSLSQPDAAEQRAAGPGRAPRGARQASRIGPDGGASRAQPGLARGGARPGPTLPHTPRP